MKKKHLQVRSGYFSVVLVVRMDTFDLSCGFSPHIRPQLFGAIRGAEGLYLVIVYFIDFKTCLFFLYRLIEVIWDLSQFSVLICIIWAMHQ